MCLVIQSYPTLCDSLDYSPLDFSVHGCSSGKNTGVGCYVLLQGIFPTQGSNPCLPHCRLILYHVTHRGSPHLFKESQQLQFPTLSGHLPNGIEGVKGTPQLSVLFNQKRGHIYISRSSYEDGVLSPLVCIHSFTFDHQRKLVIGPSVLWCQLSLVWPRVAKQQEIYFLIISRMVQELWIPEQTNPPGHLKHKTKSQLHT